MYFMCLLLSDIPLICSTFYLLYFVCLDVSSFDFWLKQITPEMKDMPTEITSCRSLFSWLGNWSLLFLLESIYNGDVVV